MLTRNLDLVAIPPTPRRSFGIMADKPKKTLAEKVDDALENQLLEHIKGAYSLVWRKITGETSLEQAMQEFDRAVSDIKTVHERVKKAIKGKF